jgi:hypothetical protein
MIALQAVVGTLIGVLTGILPNISPIITPIAASPFGEVAVACSIVSGIFTQTIKQVSTPELTGEPLLQILASKDIQFLRRYVQSRGNSAIFNMLLHKAKGAGVGIFLGLIATVLPLPFLEPGIRFAPIIIGALLIYFSGGMEQIEDDWGDLIIYLLLSAIWFHLAELSGQLHPVLTFTICMFSLPLSLKEMRQETESRGESKEELEIAIPWVQVPIVGFLSTAGVSHNLFVSLLNSTARSFTNFIFFEGMMEFGAIAKLAYSLPSEVAGTTAISSSVENVSLWLSLGVATILCFLIPILRQEIDEILFLPFYRYLGIGINLILLIMFAGWIWTPVLIGAGMYFNKKFSRLSLPIQGLVFLMPLFF